MPLLYMYDIMSYLHQLSVWWGLIASGKLAQLGKLHGRRHKERTPISTTFLRHCLCLCLFVIVIVFVFVFFSDEIKASVFGFLQRDRYLYLDQDRYLDAKR